MGAPQNGDEGQALRKPGSRYLEYHAQSTNQTRSVRDSVNKIILSTRSSFTESTSDSVELQCNCSSTESLSQNNSVFCSSFSDFVNKIVVA